MAGHDECSGKGTDISDLQQMTITCNREEKTGLGECNPNISYIDESAYISFDSSLGASCTGDGTQESHPELVRPKPWSPCLHMPNEDSFSINSSSEESPDKRLSHGWSCGTTSSRSNDWSPDTNYLGTFSWSGFGARPKEVATVKADGDRIKKPHQNAYSDFFQKEKLDNWRKAGEALKMALTKKQIDDGHTLAASCEYSEITPCRPLDDAQNPSNYSDKAKTSLASRALELVRRRQHLTPEVLWPTSRQINLGTMNLDHSLSPSQKPRTSIVNTFSCDCQSCFISHHLECRGSHMCTCKKFDGSKETESQTYCNSSCCSSSCEDTKDIKLFKKHLKRRQFSDKKTSVHTNRQSENQNCLDLGIHVVPSVYDCSTSSDCRSQFSQTSLPDLLSNHGNLHCHLDNTAHAHQSKGMDSVPHPGDQLTGQDVDDSGACSDDESGVEGECWHEVSAQLTERLYCFKENKGSKSNIIQPRNVSNDSRSLVDDISVPELVSCSCSDGSLPDLQSSSSSSSEVGVPAYVFHPLEPTKYSSGEESAGSLPDLVSEDGSRNGSSSSSNEAYADDEFECDCIHCLENNRHYNGSWMDEDSYSHESEELGQINDLFPWHFADYDPRLVDLSAMFQAVILQMLSVHPDLLDQAPPPAPPTTVNHLPTQTVDQSHIGADKCCPICLCAYELSEEVSSLPCQHQFHLLCVKAWLVKSGTCPVCRFVLSG